MTLAELLREYETRKQRAARLEATAPVAKLYELVLQELGSVDGVPALEPMMSTSAAAQLEGVDRSTIAKRCAEGLYEGAQKTSSGPGGEWRIPLSSLRRKRGRARGSRGPLTPTLLEDE